MGLPAIIGAVGAAAGTWMTNRANERAAQRAYDQQREFAQSGIQWKVQDAEKAGIHPLYALGAQTHSFTPWSVGADYSGLATAGQNLGRAIDSTRSPEGRTTALQQTAAAIQLEGLKLDNDLKRTQIASAMQTTYQAGQPPPMPTAATQPGPMGIEGQGNTPQIEGPKIELERKISPTNPGQPSAEYNQSPEVTYYRTKTGWAPMIPEGLSESMEADWISKYQWYARNKIAPMFGKGSQYFNPPAHVPLAGNQEWVYNPVVGEWRLRYKVPTHTRRKY